MKTRSRRSLNTMPLKKSKIGGKDKILKGLNEDSNDGASLPVTDKDNKGISRDNEKVDLKSSHCTVVTPIISESDTVTVAREVVKGEKEDNSKKDELDISLLLEETDDEGCGDVVTVVDDILDDIDIVQEKEEEKSIKIGPTNAKNSEDMIIHFFIKATDTNKEEDKETETAVSVEGGARKRLIEDDFSTAEDNKKQKVEELLPENDSDFCEIIEVKECWSTEDYTHLLPYYNSLGKAFYDDDDEDESAPVCVDVEPDEGMDIVKERDEEKRTKNEAVKSMKSEDMVVHFFMKATDTKEETS